MIRAFLARLFALPTPTACPVRAWEAAHDQAKENPTLENLERAERLYAALSGHPPRLDRLREGVQE